MAKLKIHPRCYYSKVLKDDTLLFCVGSTKALIRVDTWSGLDPRYIHYFKAVPAREKNTP